MIRLGLCSGAYIARDIKGVIAAAAAARLDAIEWAAELHVPGGDLRAAEEAMMGALMAGLTTASYATLYRAGAEAGDFSRFDALLDTASLMQAPILRLYACGKAELPRGGAEAEGRALERIADELRRLGDRAARKGITICLSMGRGTCLDGYDRALRLAEAVRHGFVRIAWEDLPSASAAAATAALDRAGSLAGLLVARCAGRDGRPRPIAEAAGQWRRRLLALKSSEQDPKMGSFVFLGAAREEGLPGEESLAADAAVLRSIVSEIEAK